MTILVTGAGGGIGGRVAAKLREAGHAVRGSARTLGGPGDVRLDLAAPGEDAARALDGVEAVFLYTVREFAEEFLTAARAAGVRYVVLLSSPAAFEAAEYDRPIGLVHRRVEQLLAESGLRHTVLYPSWLASNALRDWSGQIRETDRVRLPFPDAQFTPVHPGDIAEVAVRLLTGEQHRGLLHVATGPESLRQRDILALLAEARDAAIAVDELSPAEARAERPEWLPEPIFETLLHATAASVGVPALVTNTVERITGQPARTFREWAHENRDAFSRA